MRSENAEIIGLKVLSWLIAEEDLLPVFLGSSGIGVDDLRERAGEADVLAAVLDFIVMDDAWVERCCRELSLAPTDPMLARQALPGGQDVSWT